MSLERPTAEWTMLILDFAVFILNMSLKVGAQPKWLCLTTFERTTVLSFVHRAVMFASNVSFGPRKFFTQYHELTRQRACLEKPSDSSRLDTQHTGAVDPMTTEKSSCCSDQSSHCWARVRCCKVMSLGSETSREWCQEPEIQTRHLKQKREPLGYLQA